jgi:hypothetical protein
MLGLVRIAVTSSVVPDTLEPFYCDIRQNKSPLPPHFSLIPYQIAQLPPMIDKQLDSAGDAGKFRAE